jgi:hypothetical protein
MDDFRDQGCELKILEGWQPITLEEALRLNPDRKMRCPVCHGRVSARPAEANGMAAHFEHLVVHSGCYLHEAFDGNPRPYPKALR